MNRVDRSAPTRNPQAAAPPLGTPLRPAGLAMAIGSILGVAVPALALAGDAGSAISVDTSSQTGSNSSVISVGAQHWQVRSGQVRGTAGRQVGFNSFNQFGVDTGQTVDLVLPTDTTGNQVNSLVNLVWNSTSPSYINGTLNSVLADGSVGGRVYFVDPRGVLVGAQGVLNVGSLSIATPTRAVMQDIHAGGDALQGLLTGTLAPSQISAEGRVRIDGTVNAGNGVHVQARSIDVSGTILVAPRSGQTNADFDLETLRAVNLDAPQELSLVNDGGNIRLQAAHGAKVQTGLADASASVTVSGALSAQQIELTATAIADSNWDDTRSLPELTAADALNTLLGVVSSTPVGQLAFQHSATQAIVEVAGSAQLTASQDMQLSARTRQSVDSSAAGKVYREQVDPQTGQAKRHLLSAATLYGQVNADSQVNVRDGAQLQAAGALDLQASNHTTVKLSAQSQASENTTAAMTAAISNINVDSRVLVERGSQLSAHDLHLGALNQSSLQTEAIARADAQGKVGMAAAVSVQDINAGVRLDSDVDVAGDLVLDAASISSANITTALVDGPADEDGVVDGVVEAATGDASLLDILQQYAGAAFSSVASELKESDPAPAPAPAPAPFRLGAAMAFNLGTHTATASVGEDAVLQADGALVVNSQVVDAQIGTHALSNVAAQGDDGTGSGSKVAVSGAVTFSKLEHQADSLVGSGAQLSGATVGIGADVRLPRDFSALASAAPDFSSFDAFTASLDAAQTLVSDPSQLFSSYGSAKASADSAAIGGVVAYFNAINKATAKVASGARISATGSNSAPWGVALGGLDAAGKARSIDFAEAVDIAARTEVVSLHAAGDLGLNLDRVSVGQGGVAVGGSVGLVQYDNQAQALVEDAVVINSAAGVGVHAHNAETVLSLALQSGQGGSIGVNGTLSYVDVDSVTLAGISNKASVNAARLLLDAREDLFVWSVAGAVSMSDQLSVGASVAVQDLDTDTRAFIGTVGRESGAGGVFALDQLDVQANSQGMAGAVAVAGAVAMSKSAQQQEEEARQKAANPGFADKLMTAADGKVSALEDLADDALGDQASVLEDMFNDAHGALDTSSGGGKQGLQKPAYGLSASGSGTVNLVNQSTRASLEGVQVIARGSRVGLDVAAHNDTLLMGISGAGALTMANADNSSGSAALAGAVAFADIGNRTIAELVDSAVTQAGEVRVLAHSASEQVNVGLGLAVNASSDQTNANSGAGSVTIGRAGNQTQARLDGSRIDGTGADVSLLAANDNRIANGAGGLAGGGKNSVGVTVTWADVADTTEVTVHDSQVLGVGRLEAQALDASRIIAAAVAGGVSTQANGAGGGATVVINQVGNQTNARIDGGSLINADDGIAVYAGSGRLSQGGDCASAAGVDYCGNDIQLAADANADRTSGDVNSTQVQDLQRGSGSSSIIAVAGAVGVGGKAGGLAFAYNQIGNNHSVDVSNARLDVANGAITLEAADDAQILALAAGLAGSTGDFAGAGSGSYNQIDNTTAVRVGGGSTTLQADTVSLQARDDSFIGSLAGSISASSGSAGGAALTVNRVTNTTVAAIEQAVVDSAGSVSLQAHNNAGILSAAVAAGVAAQNALQGSFVWADIGNSAQAVVNNSTLGAAALAIDAGNNSQIHTLAGSVAVGGNNAVGVAANVAWIHDTTHAQLQDSQIDVAGKVSVDAASDAVTKTLAIGGAVGGQVAVAGSASANVIDSTTQAEVVGINLDAQQTGNIGSLQVGADNRGAAHSLAGAISGAGSTAVGAAVSINTVGGQTSASVRDAVLGDASAVAIDAASSTLINTLAAAGSGSGGASVAGSATTNFINTDTRASLADVSLDNAAAVVAVRAGDERQINSLAGALAGGSAGVGVAVAVNQIGGSTVAEVRGGAADRQLHLSQLDVLATAGAPGNAANIRTVAAGLGGGASVGGAGSVAVNLMDGTVSAQIADGADVVAQRVLNVAASQRQGIDVLAGSLAIGGTAAGIGVGAVVNLMTGSTLASIHGADTRVSALGWNAGTGINVDADSTQQVNTLGTSLAVTFMPIAGTSVSAMADVNVIGSSTVASIDAAAINTHDLSHWYADTVVGPDPGQGTGGGSGDDIAADEQDLYSARALGSASQDVRVSASSQVANTAYVIGAAAGAGGSAAGAAASTVLQTRTQALVSNASVQAKGEVAVSASAQQQSDTVVAGLAGGLAGGAGSAVVNVFASQTEAGLSGGSVRADALQIDAHNSSHSTVNAGAAAVGGAAMAGALVVNIADTHTAAWLGSTAGRTQVQLDGGLVVGARTDAVFDSVLVSGAGAGGVGVAGTAQFQQVTSVTDASVHNADVAAASIEVAALETLHIDSASGAAAAGGSAGVGASANIALLGSKVAATVSDSNLRSSGQLAVHAAAEREISLATVTAGIGGSVGIGGAAGVLLSGQGDLGDVLGEVGGTQASMDALASGNKLDAAITGDALLAGKLGADDLATLNQASSRSLLALGGKQDQVLAGISGGSVAAGTVVVDAASRLSTANLAGSVAAGAVGVGGAVAYTGLNGQTSAAIEQGNIQAGSVRVQAHSGGLDAQQPVSRVDAIAGAAGLVGLGAAVAISDLAQQTDASVSGVVNALGTSGSVQVQASDDSRSEVSASGAAVGAAAVGVVVAAANRDAAVNAQLGNGAQLAGFAQVGVQAIHGGGVQAQGLGAAAGLAGAGNAVVVSADDDSSTSAHIGNDARINLLGSGEAGQGVGDGSALNVAARSDARVRATATGASVSAGAAVGAVVARAASAASVAAAMGNGVSVGGLGDVRVHASNGAALGGDDAVFARAVSGSGGIFMAANGAAATAQNNSTVRASTGDNVRLGGGGDLEVIAENTTAQNAQATGITAGGLALGATVATASSNTLTEALVGDGLRVDTAMGQLQVLADGHDANRAHSIAGTGGLISGSASVATTTASSSAKALLGNRAGQGSAINAADVIVHASQASGYAGQADSTSASLAGASGAAVLNRVDSHVDAAIGDGAMLWAGKSVSVRADNQFNSLLDGAAVDAAAGGVLNGSAAALDTHLSGHTSARVGNDVRLRSGLATTPEEYGNIDVAARTTARAIDSAQLSTGGAIQAAVVDTRLTADLVNAVTVGNNSRLESLGYLNLGTTASGVLDSQALVNTWGLAAVGRAASTVNANLTETVDVGQGNLLSSLQNAYLSAGKDGTALTQSNLRVNAGAEGYVRGLVAVPRVQASATSNASMRAALGTGSTLASASDVYAGTWGDYLSRAASGRATGYQLGFIPVTVDDSRTGGGYTGVVAIDGSITAGTVDRIDVTIGNGFDCAMDIGIGYACLTVAQLKALDKGFNPGELVADTDQVVLIDDIYAAGGDVHLHGTQIGGSGSVKANSAPAVDIVNQSGRHLAFGNIYIPDYAGGSVVVTGSADTGALRIAGAAAGSSNHINIRSNQALAVDGSRGTSILQMGLVKSLAADVYYESLLGSIITGPVYAKTFNTFAPNGTFLFNDRNANFSASGGAQGIWLNYMKGLLGGNYSNADSVAGLIANLQYGGNARSQAELNNALLHRPASALHGGSAIVVYGACLPHRNGNSCHKNQNNYTDYTQFAYNNDHKMWFPTVKYVSARSGSASYAAVANELAATQGIKAREVNVTARYIDINGSIEAGAGIDWSVTIPDSPLLRNWLQARDGKGGLHQVPSYLLESGSAASSLIGVKYDATNRKFIVDDVNASGGGKVTLDGHIVSTTNAGRINVTSGYGQVRVNSLINRDVQLGSMNVATGEDGVVTIIDRNKTGPGGSPYTVWYVQKAGQAAAAYDNALCGSSCTSWEDAARIANTSSYNPLAGMRFSWTMSADIKRTVDWRNGTASNWYFVNANGGEASGAQRWSTSDGMYYRDSPGGADFQWGYTGNLSGDAGATINYGCKKAGDCNFGFDDPLNGLTWNPDRNDGDGGWQTYYDYVMPTRGSLDLNASVRADNPIAINFVSKDRGVVDVGVNSDLLLTGTLNNKAGTTTLVSRNGDIVQGNDRAALYAQDLVLQAKGDIGALGSQGINAAISDGGSLSATTGGGDIALDVFSAAKVLLQAGNAGSGYGDVRLHAAGDITGLAASGASVTGANLALVSSLGSIGAAGAPLVVASHERLNASNQLVGGVVSAQARHDIHLRDTDGDFWVGNITAEHGDVSLQAAAGSLLDAGLRTGADGLSDEQIQDIRKRLKLDGSGVVNTVAAYERQVEARYAEYWNLQGLGQTLNGQWQATAAGVAAYRARAEAAAGSARDDAQVAAYMADLYQQTVTALEDAFGSDWQALAAFQQHDDAFAFVLDATSARYQALAQNAAWDEDQLRFAINAGALEPSAASIGAASPSVSGRHVSLEAASNIGTLAADVEIDYQQLYSGQLSQADALALALATVPGDVQLIGADGQVISMEQLEAMDPAQMQQGVIAAIRIKQTSPLYVQATGQLRAQAAGAGFVYATDDLEVADLQTGGALRLTVDGDLATVGSPGAAAIRSGTDMVLTVAGDIGSDLQGSNPQAVELAVGGVLTGNAGGSASLRQQAGDLQFNSLYVGDRLQVEVAGGSLLSTNGQAVTLVAGQTDLLARDDIGAVDGGLLNVRLSADSVLNGHAGRQVRIGSSDSDLHIGQLSSGQDMQLQSAAALQARQLQAGAALAVRAAGAMALDRASAVTAMQLDGDAGLSAGELVAGSDLLVNTVDAQTLGTVRAQGNARLHAANGALVLAGNGLLQAAAVDIDAAGLVMQAGAQVLASEQADVRVRGDASIGHVAVDGVAGNGALNLDADGRIGANADVATHLIGGQGVAVNLHAGNGIGQAGAAVVVSSGSVTAQADAGDIHLHLPQGGHAGQITASAGSILLTASDALALGHVQARDRIELAGTRIDGGQLDSGQDMRVHASDELRLGVVGAGADAVLHSDGALALGQVLAGGSLQAAAGTALDAEALRSGAGMQLRAAAGITLGDARSDGGMQLVSGNNIVANTAHSGGHMQLDAGDSIDIGTAYSGGDMQLVAARAIEVQSALIGGSGDWQAGADLRADAVQAGCNFAARSGGQLSIAALQAGCGIALDGSNSLAIDRLQADGDIALRSRSGDVQAAALSSGGRLQVQAHGDIAVGQADAGAGADWTAGAQVALGQLDVVGPLSILAGGSIGFDRASSSTHAHIDAAGGDLRGGQLQAATAALSASQALDLGQARIGQQLGLAAQDIQARVQQDQAATGPLRTVITGYRDGMARRVVVEVDARDAWLIDSLRAVDAQLLTGNAQVGIGNAVVERSMDLRTAQTHLWMDNTSARLRPVDVQLTELDRTFRLGVDGSYVDTDAYVINFADGFRITSANFNRSRNDDGGSYQGENVLRHSSRLLSLPGIAGMRHELIWRSDDEPVISIEPGAVNVGALSR